MTSPDWSETDAFRDEHERLRAAADHVARAVAELTHALSQVGDHASAVALGESIESLQLTQAQLAAAAERAYSMGQLAARRARHAAFQRQVDQATAPGNDAPG
ncbi:MAG: hypothetical protein JO318_11760 [Chloroflexi bacterium]|nr:hypothetical protein [Chloroflexota bacterium]